MKFFAAPPISAPVPTGILCLALAFVVATASSQAPPQNAGDAVRVTVSMHPDGSRTVYKFD